MVVVLLFCRINPFYICCQIYVFIFFYYIFGVFHSVMISPISFLMFVICVWIFSLGTGFWVDSSFFLSTWNTLCCIFPVYLVSDEKSIVFQIFFFPVYLWCPVSLAAMKFHSLSYIFRCLTIMWIYLDLSCLIFAYLFGSIDLFMSFVKFRNLFPCPCLLLWFLRLYFIFLVYFICLY